MEDNAFILFDRITKIKSVMKQYGEENFCMSWSGGKDSCVMSALFDIAVPGNKIPRVFADTGLELSIMRKFVEAERERDGRIVIIKPSVNVKKMLETEGYPFKSKRHSVRVSTYQKHGLEPISVQRYIGINDEHNYKGSFACPRALKYQFTPENKLKISDRCCLRMKEQPLHNYKREHGYKYEIIGLMASEGGRRMTAKCMAFERDKLVAFQPLAPLTKEWENWFIREYNVRICDIYREPYNFDRTGCKGCPFNPHIQKDLDTLEKYFPADLKQCELIWKPVYDEYRRLGYRLKPTQDKAADAEQLPGQMTIEDWIREIENS